MMHLPSLNFSDRVHLPDPDRLAFGAIQVDGDGIIRQYNQAEARLSGRDPARVIGRNFFLHVAPCTNVAAFYGRFLTGVASGDIVMSFSFSFAFHMKPVQVLVDFRPDIDPGLYWIFVRPVATLDNQSIGLLHSTLPDDDTIRRCESEAIRTPGTIQPHGTLMALDLVQGTVRAVSANFADLLGLSVQPTPGDILETILPPSLAQLLSQTIRHLRDARIVRQSYRHVLDNGLAVVLCVTLSDGLALVECEPEQGPTLPRHLDADTVFDVIHKTNQLIQREERFDDIGQIAVQEIQRYTGFDRVVLYRFMPDWSGEAIAEAKATDWAISLIGLRFPASDIPRQARELYHEVPVRAMPDCLAEPVPVHVSDDADKPLDLSPVLLRALSPNHRDYHIAMEVRASWSVSLMHRGRLWGLLIGHHRTPRRIDRRALDALFLFGSILADKLNNCLDIERQRATALARSGYHRLTRTLPSLSNPILDLLDTDFGYTTLFAPCGGVAIIQDDTIRCRGQIPPIEAVRDLASWLEPCFSVDGMFHTDSLPLSYPPIFPWAEIASGLLAIRFTDEYGSMVLIFRPEQPRIIAWAGNPERRNSATLGPTRSFAQWLESRRFHSEPWAEWTVEIARDFRILANDVALVQLRALKLMNLRLAAADQAKGQFIASMSHEFRTPLNAILGFADLIKMIRPDDDELQTYTEEIATAGTHLLELVNDILQFSAVSSGKISLAQDKIDLRSACSTALTMVQAMYDSRNVRLSFETPDRPVIILGDHRRLVQILLNLLSNSLKFTPPGGSVSILIERRADHVTMIVRDTGDGIPEDKLQSVLEPFTQATNSFNRSHDGVGLGLSIVQQLMQLHDGTVTLISRLGEGTEVHLRFPLPPPDDAIETS